MAESVYDRINDYGSVKISLASPNDIRSWSFGEVKKPETINYRTYRAEKDGLFCERIFGPERDWECACGKYKGVKYKGIICDRCGVKVTHSRVRRKRMGHINLAAPIVHIWFFKSMPSRIGNLLDMKTADLEKVVYFQDYVVTDVGETPLKPRQLLTEEEFRNAKEKYGDGFKAEMGAEAVKSLLEKLDLAKLSGELREDLNNTGSKQKIKDLTKRLKIVEQLRNSENRAEWMVMDVIPVIPPDLRPLVLLDSGNFATSDLNDLYRRIINRNNRLKKLVDLNAPEVIIRNEKRMLQQAVDALFDNNRCRRPVLGSSNRPLKSLTDMIKGKQGRFRENLLGKRVDYSARSVIVVGPELKLWQCGLPKKIALELYQPFIIRKLKERGMADTIKSAKKMLERKDEEVWDILEQVIYQHPVLLNRAPTLHRMGIQGFEPVLVEGNAIKIHPLVCKGFNADFDGDQMAVHLPLSIEAQVEVNTLMLSPNNIFSPSNGSPIIGPSQDIVLGIYYMTAAVSGERGNEKCDPPAKNDPGRTAVEFYGTLGADGKLEMAPLFRHVHEVFMAHQQGKVGTHARIRVRVDKKKVKEEIRIGDKKEVRVSDAPANGVITTTVGRVIFNDILPQEMPFYNMTLSQKGTNGVISDCYAILGRAATINLLDAIKVLGFKQSTLAGLSFAASDLRVPVDKDKIIKEADAKAEKITREFEQGAITDSERHGELIDCWTHARETVTTAMVESLRKDVRDGKPYLNPVFLMMDSGARGSRDQVRQLAGMRGLMAKPSGEIIETPIKSNFREGLNVLEYFSSTHGARKGLADTALKTADSGYLTRKLADVAQNVIINELDCGTLAGITKNAVYKGENKEVTLASMIQGRTSRQSILDPKTDDSIVAENQLITRDIAARIEEELSIDSIRVRSPLTCESPLGVCARCYGADLSTGKQVEEGLAVGIIGAQSIGEPGTQLTMRTFHIGGTSSVITQQNDISSGEDGVMKFHNVTAVQARGEGKATRLISLKRNGELLIRRDDGYELERHLVPYGANILVKDGDKVKKGQKVCEWDAHRTPILAESAGSVKFQDVVEGETMRRESRGRSRGSDRSAGTDNRVIVEHKGDLHPRIFIEDKNGQRLEFHHLPAKAHLAVQEGDEVRPGDLLAHTPRAATGNQDITGGLPRVTEIFEARKPKDPATMAEDAGSVALPTERRKGKTTILVQTKGPKGDIEHHVPHGRRLLVLAGDTVEAGDPLIEGPLVPHDILRIKGEEALQQYLLDEVQKVYRSQKVEINDKHIEIIVSQMLRKVKVEKPGDTKYLPGEVVDKFKFRQTNKDLEKKTKVVDPGDTELAKEQILGKDELKAANEAVEEKGGRPASGRRPEKSTAKTLLLGITKASLQSESFVSAASFQETTKVLTEAALAGKQDELLGLKENVILGHLIPAGTAFKPHLELVIRGEGEPVEDARRREIREEEARVPSAPAPEVSVAGGAGSAD